MSKKARVCIAVAFVVILALHAVVQVGPFLTGRRVPEWDTHFYFPSFFYFTVASVVSDGELPWWSPLSQEGIPLNYLLFATYPPTFPTTPLFIGACVVSRAAGLPVSVYQLYIFQQLLLNPALVVFLTLAISLRLFKHPLAHVTVMALAAFCGNQCIHVLNAHYYTVEVVFLALLYALVRWYQQPTATSRFLLGAVVIFLAANVFSTYSLHLLMFAVPLLLASLWLFYPRLTADRLKGFVRGGVGKARASLWLAVLFGALASLAVVLINIKTMDKPEPVASWDPVMWTELPAAEVRVREVLPQLRRMFVDDGPAWGHVHDYTGLATLGLLVAGLILGRGRMRFVLLLTLLGLLCLLCLPVPYILLCNALSWLQKSRHLGEIMVFGGSLLVVLGAGYGVEALMASGPPGRRWCWRVLAVVAIGLAMAGWLALERCRLTNVVAWLAVTALALLTLLRLRWRGLLSGCLLAGLVGFSAVQMLRYNRAIIDRSTPDVPPPRFIERGFELKFLMTGSYITRNSILRGGQGYFFGDEDGVERIRARHTYFNYMHSVLLRRVSQLLPRWKFRQLAGDEVPRIRFPSKVYYARSKGAAMRVLKRLPNLSDVAVLTVDGLRGRDAIEVPYRPPETAPAVEVRDFGFNRLVLEVRAERECLLYYADGYDRFWTARVNGRRRKVYQANLIHKAVWIPPGRSEVRFEYNPWPVRLPFWASLWFAACYVYWCVRGMRGRRDGAGGGR